jgi:hypothetical protein
MRVMVIVKATPTSESGALPDVKMLAEMGKFNEELVKAGVMLAADGLHASSRGKRLVMSKGKRTVVDGPFAETKELIAGYWVWQVKSMDEAMAWLARCPDPMPGEDSQIEVRPIMSEEELLEMVPGLREQEQRQREAIAPKA